MVAVIKTCNKCGEIKELTEFYRSSISNSGLCPACKQCAKKYRDENKEKINFYSKEYRKTDACKIAKKKYQQTEAGRAGQREGHKKYQAKHPEKRYAQIKANNAIRDGRLFRQPCGTCGNKKVEAHHEDYSKPLEVVWLCKKHHLERHYNYN